MNIHERIKNRRIELGLSLTDLAERVGVAYQTVQAWERAEKATAPARPRLKKVADVLKVSVEWLTAGIDATLDLDGKHAFIPLYRGPLAKDGDVEYHDEIEHIEERQDTYAYRKDMLAELGLEARHCRVVLLHDTSMSLGNQLLVDLTDTTIRSGKVYALETMFGVIARRLYLNLDDAKVTVRADDPNVADKVMDIKELPLVGRVVAFQGPLL